MPEPKKFLDTQGLTLYDSKIKEWVSLQLPEALPPEEVQKMLDSPKVINSALDISVENDIVNYEGYIELSDDNGILGVDREAYLYIKSFSTAGEENICWFISGDIISDISSITDEEWEELTNGVLSIDTIERNYVEDGDYYYRLLKIENENFLLITSGYEV